MKQLLIKSIYLTAIILLISACSSNSSSDYVTPPDKVLQAAILGDYLVSPEEVDQLISEPGSQFIDLRSSAEFAMGSIDNAINIPTQNLLEPAHKTTLNQADKTFILFGNSELAANGPWILLRQLGYNNIKVLQGGYDYWSDWEADGDYLTEIARFPYDSIFVLATLRTKMEEEALRAKPIVVKQTATAPKKKIVPKKKVVVEEEEEGC